MNFQNKQCTFEDLEGRLQLSISAVSSQLEMFVNAEERSQPPAPYAPIVTDLSDGGITIREMDASIPSGRAIVSTTVVIQSDSRKSELSSVSGSARISSNMQLWTDHRASVEARWRYRFDVENPVRLDLTNLSRHDAIFGRPLGGGVFLRSVSDAGKLIPYAAFPNFSLADLLPGVYSEAVSLELDPGVYELSIGLGQGTSSASRSGFQQPVRDNASELDVAWLLSPLVPGDITGDFVVNEDDIDALVRSIRNDSDLDVDIHDLNEDGEINDADIDYLVRDILGTDYGDANLDGRVDFADFLILASALNEPGGWAHGNFNGGGVDHVDFEILSNNFGFVATR